MKYIVPFLKFAFATFIAVWMIGCIIQVSEDSSRASAGSATATESALSSTKEIVIGGYMFAMFYLPFTVSLMLVGGLIGAGRASKHNDA